MDSARWAGGRMRRRSTSTSLRSRCKLSGRRCCCIAWERGRRRSSSENPPAPVRIDVALFPWAEAPARPLRAPLKGACLRQALLLAFVAIGAPLAAQDTARTVLRAATVLDGRGGVQHNVDIFLVGNRIARIAPRGTVPAGTRVVDLGDRTVLPGLIDAHAHPVWYFNRKNRLHTADDGDTPAQSTLAAAANAYATLLAGFTTIQSVGSRSDADLRDWI